MDENGALTARSLALVQGPGQLPVGFPGSLQFGLAFLQGRPQIDGLLSQTGDRPLEFLDIGGGTEAGLAPGLFPQSLGQTLLQLLDAGNEPGVARLSVGEIGLE